MSLINLTINGKPVSVEKGSTILDAANAANIKIPTLCYLNLHEINFDNKPASCRVCVVEVEGNKKNLPPACATLARDGMVVRTDTPKVRSARKTVVELLLSDHPQDCLACDKNTNCELQSLAYEFGIRNVRYLGEKSEYEMDTTTPSIVKDSDKCILCRRCETMCNEVQTVGVLSAVDRGFETDISPFFYGDMCDTACTFCGQCVAVCPTGALSEVNNIDKAWDAIHDKEKVVIVQTAPAVRVALGEEFGMKAGEVATAKMATALRNLGFNKVFDTDFAADLTIMEEASELLHRIKDGGTLPLFTSCCPGWVKFLEHQYPDFLDNPSSCKSPQEMFGAIAKSYLAEKMEIDPKNMVVVSIMPCVSKKYEAAREELSNDDLQDVDIVLTTRELAKMIKEAGIDFKSLEDGEFDHPLGESTGAAVIFGATGGVMEAALRTAYEWITESTLDSLDFTQVRGLEGIKEATVKINDLEVKVAVVHGLGNARKLMEDVKSGKANYHIVEVMACPGGCIGGGGQPYHFGNIDVLKNRTEGLYKEDRDKTLRKSHENPNIIKLYSDYLGKPYSDKAHKLLHTHYVARAKN